MAGWSKLKQPPQACPVLHANDCNLMVLNDEELLFVPKAEMIPSLWKYNIKANNWVKWFDIPSCFAVSPQPYVTPSVYKYHTSSLDKKNMILYIFSENGYICNINLKTQTFTRSKMSYHDGSYSKSLYIHGQFHVFFGWNANTKYHYIWNQQKQSLDKIYEFKTMVQDIPKFHCQSIMYLSSKRTVLIMPRETRYLYVYSLINKTCIKKPVGFNGDVFDQGIVTKDEQYVICFLQRSKWKDILSKEKAKIVVLDLKTMNVRKCAINAPSPYAQALCIRQDVIKQKLSTNGYVRRCWNLKEFLGIRYPPIHLTKIIESYVVFETIHYLNESGHWMINVQDIFDFLV